MKAKMLMFAGCLAALPTVAEAGSRPLQLAFADVSAPAAKTAIAEVAARLPDDARYVFKNEGPGDGAQVGIVPSELASQLFDAGCSEKIKDEKAFRDKLAYTNWGQDGALTTCWEPQSRVLHLRYYTGAGKQRAHFEFGFDDSEPVALDLFQRRNILRTIRPMIPFSP